MSAKGFKGGKAPNFDINKFNMDAQTWTLIANEAENWTAQLYKKLNTKSNFQIVKAVNTMFRHALFFRGRDLPGAGYDSDFKFLTFEYNLYRKIAGGMFGGYASSKADKMKIIYAAAFECLERFGTDFYILVVENIRYHMEADDIFSLLYDNYSTLIFEAAQAVGVHATAYALERLHAQPGPEITARDFEL